MGEIYLVMGMHKSGTTLVSEMLHHSGIPMVEHDTPTDYDAGNHYERISTNLVNKELLNCGNKNSLLVRKRLDWNAVSKTAFEKSVKLVAELESADPWGFKDPRTCLTYEFWEKYLPPHKVIGVFRNPRAVYNHYRIRHRRRILAGVNALLSWHAYNQAMLELATRKPDSILILDYDSMMGGREELDRLSAWAGREIVDKRSDSLARSAEKNLPKWDRDLWIASRLFAKDIESLYQKLKGFRNRQMANLTT